MIRRPGSGSGPPSSPGEAPQGTIDPVIREAGCHDDAPPMTAAHLRTLFPARACMGLKWRLIVAANA